ncbi:MAG: tetratricopeptide repeat protein [Verrucomicrobiota bacterium]
MVLITLVTFAPVVRYEFINFDDPDYVTENKLVQRGITWEGTTWAFQTGRTGNWHPVTWLSHMLDCQIYGVKPAGHHFTSVIFHIANTLLLFAIFTSATSALWRSALVAALFALHPLHVESVAWVSERKDVLSTFFLLLAVGSYFRHAKILAKTTEQTIQPRQQRTSYFLSLIFFALGLMSKPMLVTLPFLLLLLDFWPLRRIQYPPLKFNSRLIYEKIPFFGLSIISSIATFYVQKEGGSVSSLTHLSLTSRLANALVSYCRYIWKAIWPVDLAVLYPMREWALWQSLGATLFLILITMAALRAAARRPYFVTGWFWFLGTLVPVIGLVQVGVQSMADRYSYVPLIGLFITLVWGIHEFLMNKGKQLPFIFAAVAISACALATRVQLQYWQNGATVFERALAVTKDNFTAHANLGVVLGRRGRVTESIQHYRAALKIKPDHGETHYNLANALARIGETTDAISHYQAALKANPKDAQAHNNLAVALQKSGVVQEVEMHFREAIRLKPDNSEAHFNFALFLVKQGRGEAIQQFLEVIRLEPGNEQAHFQLGILLASQKQLVTAIEHLRTAVRLKPGWPAPLNFLARVLATSNDLQFRNGKEAVELAKRSCELVRYENPVFLDTFAAALAEAGQFPEAIQTATQSKNLAIKMGQTKLAEQIGAHLERFQSNEALREF